MAAAKEFTILYKEIFEMDETELLSRNTFDFIFSLESEVEKTRFLFDLQDRAETLKCTKKVNSLIKAYKVDESKNKFDSGYAKYDFYLEYEANGKIKTSITNYENIIRNDKHFIGLRFNLLSNTPEIMENDRVRQWKDCDDTYTLSYIYDKYKIHNKQMCLDALTNVFYERPYHPVKECINALQWDGKSRIKDFLTFALQCEDKPYIKEVSRLIFAGGIHRIYNPGCKFDNVPVLIGSQGEGKSTIVRWLALEDGFYSEISTIEGKEGMEALSGKWICELSELMAVSRTKEVEAVKSFLSRQTDHFRRAFERRTTDFPRQNIFIGTTNKEQFLKDKSGNRRWLPVKVNSNGYDIFNRQNEIKEYIRQCWAEAKELYDNGELLPYPDYALINEIKTEQDAALEEDYRVGMIKSYLDTKRIDEVCILDLWEHALQQDYTKPSRKDSDEIVQIMANFNDWQRMSGVKRFVDYGVQRYWKRKQSVTS